MSNKLKEYKHSTPMTDDTAWIDVIPAGYMLEKIVFVETGGVESVIDLGTASGGSDIFKNQTIIASEITTIVINKTFSMLERQSLYLNDNDAGSAWGVGSSIIALLLMRRAML